VTLKAYFVEKSSYDLNIEDGSYFKDELAVESSVESSPVCGHCTYIRRCGTDFSKNPDCMSGPINAETCLKESSGGNDPSNGGGGNGPSDNGASTFTINFIFSILAAYQLYQ